MKSKEQELIDLLNQEQTTKKAIEYFENEYQSFDRDLKIVNKLYQHLGEIEGKVIELCEGLKENL